jgi:hypothetical protein
MRISNKIRNPEDSGDWIFNSFVQSVKLAVTKFALRIQNRCRLFDKTQLDMKVKLLKLLGFSLILLLLNCQKKDFIDNSNNSRNSLVILKNYDTIAYYIYYDSMVIYSKTFYDQTMITDYIYNSSDSLIRMVINDLSTQSITYKDINYNSSGLINTIDVSRVNQSGDSLTEKQVFDYDPNGNLVKINAYLPETFKYKLDNVIENGKVNVKLLVWTDYIYTYDSKYNPLLDIGLPKISAINISNNNITSVIAHWTSYSDCLMPPDTEIVTFDHIDTIYNSEFDYNSDNLPFIEYRHYSDRTDTLEYLYN